MTNLAQATAAPAQLKINGSTYRLRPLRERDYGEIEQWLRSRALAVVRDNLDGFAADDRRILLERAYDKANAMSITSPDAMSILLSRSPALDGAAARTHRPDA
jgi:hypothetical protein